MLYSLKLKFLKSSSLLNIQNKSGKLCSCNQLYLTRSHRISRKLKEEQWSRQAPGPTSPFQEKATKKNPGHMKLHKAVCTGLIDSNTQKMLKLCA